VKKTEEEAAALKKAHEEKAALKAERRKAQVKAPCMQGAPFPWCLVRPGLVKVGSSRGVRRSWRFGHRRSNADVT
jgi:hypothetical protein